MKKTMKRFFAALLASTMMFATLSLTAAAEGEEFEMFIAIGADAEAENDWGLQYYGDGASDNVGDIVATNATAKVGDTVTIGLTMPTEVVYTWFMAPVLVAEGVGNVDYTIDSIKLDGEDILGNVDLAAGDAWWYEGTGPYTSEQSIRLAGGFNEWGTKYMAESPAGFTSIEYTITINNIEFGAAAGELIPSTESYEAFIAIGADRDGENDWSLEYYGDASIEHAAGITATNGIVKAGETTTISLEFENPVLNVWFMAPCLIFPNGDAAQISSQSEFDIKVYVDDVEVDVDFSAGAICWAEGTGDYPTEYLVRLAGGYNEWGAQYIAEPSGFTKITYEITANSILLAPVEEDPQFEFDPNGTYHAYLGVQTPTWIFRNAFNDASYGLDVDGGAYFGELGFVDGGWVAQGGTFTDVEITGNGTYTVSLTGFDFSGEFNGATILGTDGTFNLLFVSTDLPRNDDVVISNVVLKMDGKEITTQAEPFLDPDQKEVQSILLANIWNNEISPLPYYAAPTDSIEISFTVSGFANDAEVAAPETTPETTPVEPADGNNTDSSADTAPADDETSGESSGFPTVAVVGIVAAVVVVAAGAGVVVAKKKKK